MHPERMKKTKALSVVVIGAAICAAGIYVGDTDDAPGAALIGILVLIGAVILSVKIAKGTPSRGSRLEPR